MSGKIDRRGDDKNYIELRWVDGEHTCLDEIVAIIEGKCVFHLEAMSNESYWFSLDMPNVDGSGIHANVGSKTGRAEVVATAEWL